MFRGNRLAWPENCKGVVGRKVQQFLSTRVLVAGCGVSRRECLAQLGAHFSDLQAWVWAVLLGAEAGRNEAE